MYKLLLRHTTWPLAWCLAILSFFTSCEQGDNEGLEPKPTPTTCRLVKEYNPKDTASYTTYQYDSQNRLTLQTNYEESKPKSTYAFSFNAAGQMEKMTVKFKVSYFYGQQEITENVIDIYSFERNTQGQITKFLKTRPLPTTGYYAEGKLEGICTYDSEGNRTRVINNYYTNMEVTETVREYTYVNGNCTKEVITQSGFPEIKTEYEYYLDKEDKLKDFYQHYLRKNLMGPTANKNLKKKETKYNNGQVGATLSISHVFNEQGYVTDYVMDYNFKNPNGVEADITTTIAEYDCF